MNKESKPSGDTVSTCSNPSSNNCLIHSVVDLRNVLILTKRIYCLSLLGLGNFEGEVDGKSTLLSSPSVSSECLGKIGVPYIIPCVFTCASADFSNAALFIIITSSRVFPFNPCPNKKSYTNTCMYTGCIVCA